MTTNQQTKYRLFSLHGRGRAELIRYIFAFSGRPYEDCRLTLEQWKTIKNDCVEELFLPILEIDEAEILTGSFIIARYLAQKFGLCGRNNWEAAQADMFVQGVADLYPNLAPVVRSVLGKQEAKKKEIWEWFKLEHLNPFLGTYTAALERNRYRNGGWFVTNRVTWGDLAVGEMLSRLESCCDSLVLKEFPTLKDHMEKVEKLPRLKVYLADRPHALF